MSTKRQIAKKMKAASIAGELTGRGQDWEVTLDDEATKGRFCSEVEDVDGFMNGWGGWILRPGYRDLGDWNDVSSAHHY